MAPLLDAETPVFLKSKIACTSRMISKKISFSPPSHTNLAPLRGISQFGFPVFNGSLRRVLSVPSCRKSLEFQPSLSPSPSPSQIYTSPSMGGETSKLEKQQCPILSSSSLSIVPHITGSKAASGSLLK